MPVRFQLVIDCADPDRLARFWAAALGYELHRPQPVSLAGTMTIALSGCPMSNWDWARTGSATRRATGPPSGSTGARCQGGQEPAAPRHRRPAGGRTRCDPQQGVGAEAAGWPPSAPPSRASWPRKESTITRSGSKTRRATSSISTDLDIQYFSGTSSADSVAAALSRSWSQPACSMRAHARDTDPVRIPRRASGSFSAKMTCRRRAGRGQGRTSHAGRSRHFARTGGPAARST